MIRVARPDDASAIAAVHVASWRAAYRGLMPEALLERFTVEARRAGWEQNLRDASDARRTTVVERAGRVVAFATFGVSRDTEGAGEVWAVYAHPETWGTGAGRALLDDGIAYLRARGLDPIELWVLEGNARAIRFYERAGFRCDGGRKTELGLPHVRMRARCVPDASKRR